jgi:adenylate cyclase
MPDPQASQDIEQTLTLARDQIELEIATSRTLLFGFATLVDGAMRVLVGSRFPWEPIALPAIGALFAVVTRARVKRKGAETWLALLSMVVDLTLTGWIFIAIHHRLVPDDPTDVPMFLAILAVVLVESLAIGSQRLSPKIAIASTVYALGVFLWVGSALVTVRPVLITAAGLLAFMAPYSLSVARRARKNLDLFSRLQLLRRYLAPAAVERILREHPDEALAVGGQLVTITMLAADLRGFTAMSEALDPVDVVAQLNEYHQAMLEQIDRFGGTLDKFIGDGTLAVFGLPQAGSAPTDAGAQAGVDCARSMLEALGALNARRGARGLAPLKIGIGLCTGPVVAGNIGAPGRRLEFTVIGDTVNTAARLEGLTKELGVQVLVSEPTRARLADPSGLAAPQALAVRGKERPILASAL